VETPVNDMPVGSHMETHMAEELQQKHAERI